MKYVLMYASHYEIEAAVPTERQTEVYGQIFGWFDKHSAAFVDQGQWLQPPQTATTVKAGADGGGPIVVDGPYSEAKELIGGYSVVEVPDLDTALAMAKEWPALVWPGVSVEIRPVVEQQM